MLFKFDIKQSEQDYLEYNIFHILKSPYGKKQVLSFRILLTLVIFIGVLFVLITDGFSARAFVDSIPLLLLLLIMQLTLKKFLILSLKGNIKRLKKAGKMPYSPESVIEVYDDKFVEITDTQRIEQNFSLVERVSVVDNKMVYIQC